MKRVFFIEMMGVPGSYDASVYDNFEDKDNEGRWFTRRFGDYPGLNIQCRNVCLGETLPGASEVDGLVLAGTYNSVHDNTEWQQHVLDWLPVMRSAGIPLLGICGSHQLIAHMYGAGVVKFNDGPYAGSFSLDHTEAARECVLFNDLPKSSLFHFANTEHVTDLPANAELLASSGKTPVAALDYGGHWYTTQFHPEGTHETLGITWSKKNPALQEHYRPCDAGDQLVRNFLGIVAGMP